MSDDYLGPLTGIKVLDLSRALSGPYASLMLADAGADVIKVERPTVGDDSRGWGPPFIGVGEDRESVYFLSVNRNKRSISLDLKDANDLGVLHRLIGQVDVLIENFRPGVMDRLGLDPETLEGLNPRLIVLSITGFGEGGPDGQRAGFDQIIQGESGLMGITGPQGGPPTKMGVPITDILSGMFGAYGIVAALHERDHTGRGQRVTTSLLASAVGVHVFQGARWTVAGEVAEPAGNRHPTIAPYGSFQCSDGYLNIAVGSEELWRRFAPLVHLDGDDDPAFATNADRVAHWNQLEEKICAVLVNKSVDDWIDILEAAGVPAGRIRRMDEVYDWPQLDHLRLIERVIDPTAGALDLPGAPVRYSHLQRRESRPPPRLGEHTREILREFE